MLKKAAFFTILVSQLAFGETSVSPYIDQLKAKMESEGKAPSQPERPAGNPEPYIQSIREKMRDSGHPVETSQGTQPYIDRLKSQNSKLNEPLPGKNYSEDAKSQLAPDEPGGAIQAVHEGRSDLHMKRPGHINASAGFKISANVSHSFSGDPSVVANSFNTIYGSGWVPDFTFVGEYRPFYSETYGSLGFIGTAGVSIFKANGRFSTQLTQPDGTDFSLTSRTKLTFLSVPVTVGAKYQFNLTHLIRPYAVIGPTLVGISENRNDGIGSKKALSKGITTSVGGAFLLDWISGGNTWNLYQDFGVKHFYLTLEYTKLTTVSSAVDISYSGLTGGFAFDF